MTERGITRDDLDECWCCGGLHDRRGTLCPDCDDAGCNRFTDECESDHQPALADGGSAGDGRGDTHALEVDMPSGARQDPAYHFAVAGLAVASRWEMEDGAIYRVEKVNRYETREHGGKATQPRIVFENGSSWVGGQFIADVNSGALNPEDPMAFSIAKALNHPRFRDTEGDDGE